MKVKELIEVLQNSNPESKVLIGFSEQEWISEVTPVAEDRIEPVRAVYVHGAGDVVVASDCYLVDNKIWPEPQ